MGGKMTVDNEERNICAEISKKYKDVRFYNVKSMKEQSLFQWWQCF